MSLGKVLTISTACVYMSKNKIQKKDLISTKNFPYLKFYNTIILHLTILVHTYSYLFILPHTFLYFSVLLV
nr:MAG TPA: hypothetical protein [Caudoviricetes sp.]